MISNIRFLFKMRLVQKMPFILLCLLLNLTSIQAQPATDGIGKIDGKVVINFAAQQLSAELKYDYIALEDRSESLVFYLNQAFDVKRVSCRLCESFNFDRQAKPDPSLVIKLKKPLAKGQRLPIEIQYNGSLKNIYKPDYRFLELGLDNFWFPIHPATVGFNFRYRLSIKTDEPRFELVANGRSKREGSGWLVESKVPDFDIDLVFSEGLTFKTYTQGGYNLKIVSNMPDEATASLLTSMKAMLDFYNSSFGASDPQREITGVFRPHPGVEGQGGYFRKGYFVFPKTDNVENLVLPIAHELAHYWWLKAGRQHAWLNESFAEYSALLFVRQKQGSEAFQKLLEDKRNRSVNLPPIYGFDRTKNRQAAPGVFYRKGPVKLSELEKELGEQKFMDFLTQVAKAEVRDTDALIELLAQVSTREVADRFLLNLKQ
jgi:Peptidase family M1 domain